MKTTFDPEADAFYVRLVPEGTQIDQTQEVAPGVLIDVDAGGHVVGIEVLSVTARSAGLYGAVPVRSAAE